MKKLWFTVLVLATGVAAQAQNVITCAEARSKGPDSVVTVTGIVTSGAEFNPARYFQDASGGLSIYWNNPAVTNLQPGDSVVITGRLDAFNNLLQIGASPTPTVTKVSSGHAVPEALEFNPSDIGDAFAEQYEGMLVKLKGIGSIKNLSGSNCTTVPTTFSGNTNYCLNSSAATALRVNAAASDLVGKAVPGGTFDVVGIMSQYKFGAYDPTAAEGFQFLPRVYPDFILASTPNIISTVKPININTNALTITFQTLNDGNTIVEWGTTNALGNIDSNNTAGKNHSLDLSSLSPATVYYVRVSSRNGSGISSSAIVPVITKSLSTGDIKIYFNHPVNTGFASNSGNHANYLNQAVDDTLIQYINRAKQTVDVTIYNWTADFNNITNALNNAYNRGVRVRVIYEEDNANTGVNSLNAAIGRTTRLTSTNIMHNKFVVIDAHHSDPNVPVLWTGSTNWTDGQINDDPNSVIVVQDQSLAITYEMEFEEMWGSNGAQPGTTVFGASKSDNTPHYFNIGGRPVECYFSPSDNANARIIETIKTANHDIQIATMLCTRSDLAGAVVSQLNAASIDRNCSAVIMNDTSGGAGPFYTLRNALPGRVNLHKQGVIMHHKYMIIDAGDSTSDPIVLDGSHNWSNNANNGNDENTLIIHDKNIANQYYQEFVNMLGDMGVNACNFYGTSTGIKVIPAGSIKLYPNPTHGDFSIELGELNGEVNVTITDLTGRTVWSNNMHLSAYQPLTLNGISLEQGAYLVQVKGADFSGSTKLIVTK